MSHFAETPSTFALRDLGFQLLAPCEPLRPYIAEYWYFRRSAPLAIYREEYMHPTGGFGIVFNFGGPVRLDGQPLNTPIFLDGSNTVSRKMGFFGQVDLIGIRFREGGAYPFLALPLGEVRNEIALLDAAETPIRPALMQLYARLYEASSFSTRVHLLDRWLLDQLASGRDRDPLIPASLALLRAYRREDQDDELPAMTELARLCNISQRQLERLYQRQVGMSPRQYVKLQRIETARLALKGIHAGESSLTTTDLAVDLGFYDQSHFIREFSAVIGMTPYRYLKRSLKKDAQPASETKTRPQTDNGEGEELMKDENN